MSDELLLAVYDALDEVKKSNAYQKMMNLNKEIEMKLNDELKEFKEAKEKFEEARKYSNYHPDFKIYASKLSKIKEKLYTNKLVIEYKKAEKEVENLIEEINDGLKQVLRG